MPLPTQAPGLAQLVELQTNNPRVMGLTGEGTIFFVMIYIGKGLVQLPLNAGSCEESVTRLRS